MKKRFFLCPAALLCLGLVSIADAQSRPDPVFDAPTAPILSSPRTDLVAFADPIPIGEVMDGNARLQISNWGPGQVVCELRTGNRAEMRQAEWPVAFQALIAPAPHGNVTIEAIPDLHQQRLFCTATEDGFISWSQLRMDEELCQNSL